MNRKKRYTSYIYLIIILLFLTACSTPQSDDNQNQALQAQLSALETQNALLLTNQTASQQDPSEQRSSIQVPHAPTDIPAAVIPTLPSVVDTLPSGPVPAGQPISYEGWSMTVDPNIEVRGDNLWFTIHIRNLKETSRIFRYQDRSVTLFDNTGNQYFTRPDCVQYLDTIKNLAVEASSSASVSTGGYCYMENVGRIPEFIGPVALNAKQLILRFTSFGPFNNIEVFFEL